MWNSRAQAAGGKTSAEKQRKEAIDNYYQNPKKCLYCESIIEVREGVRVAEIKKKKFCNKSCAASFNNKSYPKRIAQTHIECLNCNEHVILNKGANGSINNKKKYCDECRKIIRLRFGENSLLEFQTKESLYSRRAGWQSANSSIRTHSRKIYFNSTLPKCCKVCGYDKHIEICHIKAVAYFADTAKISDINALDNLVALCPNHHWEFDNLEVKYE